MVEDIGPLGAIGAVVSTDSAASYESGSDSTATASAGARQPSPPNVHNLQSVVDQVNGRLASINQVLELNVDRVSGLTVAIIRNSENGEVLQQFPGKDALHLAQMLAEWAGGNNALLDLIA